MGSLKIGFIGAGNMAQALAKGLINSGVTKASNIIASSPPADLLLLEKMKELGCSVTHDNCDAAVGSDVAVLAVKPDVLPAVLGGLRGSISPHGPLVASIAMGVPLAQMEALLPPGCRVVRGMPNTPALLQEGASVFCRGACATDGDAGVARRLLSSVGDCYEVPEKYVNAVTALSGAGPAYAFLMIEALADGGVRVGLPRALALRLAAKTLLGAAKMVLVTGQHPGELKDAVCSPGGCTIAGVSSLERAGLRGALIQAVTHATQRAQQLSDAAPLAGAGTGSGSGSGAGSGAGAGSGSGAAVSSEDSGDKRVKRVN